VLLLSQSTNRPKVELLIAIKDRAQALHYRKANVLVKSKPKSQPSVCQAPLLCPFETCAFSLAPASLIYLQQSAAPADFATHLIIKKK